MKPTRPRLPLAIPCLAAALLCACGGDARNGSAAAPPDTSWQNRRVWTPEQARAMRASADSLPPPAAAVPQPGPAEGEDSAQWMAEEARKFEERRASMQPFDDCMAGARRESNPSLRKQMEGACRNLPSAPR
jgi:hypothetical protein